MGVKSMQNNAEFVHLKRFMATFDWLPITEILGKKTDVSKKGDYWVLNVDKYRIYLNKQ